MIAQLDYRRVIIGLLAFSVFTYEGFRQMYRAKHVDRLERDGKIPPDMAMRIRRKPMRLIGWAMIVCGFLFLLTEIFRF